MITVHSIFQEMLSEGTIKGYLHGKKSSTPCEIILSTATRRPRSCWITIKISEATKDVNIDKIIFHGDADINTSIRALIKLEAFKKIKEIPEPKQTTISAKTPSEKKRKREEKKLPKKHHNFEEVLDKAIKNSKEKQK